MPTAPRTDLLALYRSRQASPVEATRAVLERIDALNPTLNAFCLLAADEALASAEASEARWRRGHGRCGPLDGVPTSIKDLILTKGWPTLRGSRTVDPNQPWDIDAPATARLREAGAVLIGKTTTPEFGCKGETNSPLTGITRNPWDPTKTPGGSSGGTAAAVAAGMGPLSVGTDGAGSVRIPAAFCGNFGLKPSFGRVPAYPLSPFGTVSHLGPHTMSVRDAALMMNVLKQPDARDWTSLPPDGTRLPGGARRRHRRPAHRLFADARLRQGHRPGGRRRGAPAAVNELPTLGAHVEAGRPGLRGSARDHHRPVVHRRVDAVEHAERRAAGGHRSGLRRRGASSARRMSALDVQRLNLRRGALGSHMRQFMQRFDLLVTPSVAVPAFEARPAGHVPLTRSRCSAGRRSRTRST